MTELTREQVAEWEEKAETMQGALMRKRWPALCRALLDTQDKLALAMAEVRAGRQVVGVRKTNASIGSSVVVKLRLTGNDATQAQYLEARAALGEEV